MIRGIQLKKFLCHDKDGQDLIEYALLAAFIAVSVAATFPTTINPNISTIMSKVLSTLINATSAS